MGATNVKTTEINSRKTDATASFLLLNLLYLFNVNSLEIRYFSIMRNLSLDPQARRQGH